MHRRGVLALTPATALDRRLTSAKRRPQTLQSVSSLRRKQQKFVTGSVALHGLGTCCARGMCCIIDAAFTVSHLSTGQLVTILSTQPYVATSRWPRKLRLFIIVFHGSQATYNQPFCKDCFMQSRIKYDAFARWPLDILLIWASGGFNPISSRIMRGTSEDTSIGQLLF